MKIELIPVIEITYFNEILPPDHGPFWEFPNEWKNYTEKRLKKAGFLSAMDAYSMGSSFFEPAKIPLQNLRKLILDWFSEFDGSNIDEILPLYGGYVLNINGEDMYFPQCCGDLGDIVYWERIIKNKKSEYYNGHPSPIVTFTNSEIVLDFDETEEEFCPPAPKQLRLNIKLMEQAYERTLLKLIAFEANILEVENELNLNLTSSQLVDLLIYRNQELMT